MIFATSTTVLLVIISILAVCLAVSLFYLIRFGLIIIRVQDVLEVSLDMLDDKYATISKVLSTPLFYNSPEIRGVLENVREVRESILEIAHALTSIHGSLEVPSINQADNPLMQGNKEIGNEKAN
ncbi:MAG: hypothetical protein CME70_06360 [Halobacteriovorax sp.]|nr:hypothetical protein [Halobacteriovorax sp.]MBK23613.1 hypothetical protein [Halobacteriovorax sp.]|tara:strand:- start:1339 stop:1713 length:375 start_codon:yes stop_codon:yes gene_type:complete